MRSWQKSMAGLGPERDVALAAVCMPGDRPTFRGADRVFFVFSQGGGMCHLLPACDLGQSTIKGS